MEAWEEQSYPHIAEAEQSTEEMWKSSVETKVGSTWKQYKF